MPPRHFRKAFEDVVPTAEFLGRLNWTRGFVDRVWNGEVEGITFEGVVGKSGNTTHKLVRAKAKTKAWVDRVKKIHGNKAQAILDS